MAGSYQFDPQEVQDGDLVWHPESGMGVVFLELRLDPEYGNYVVVKIARPARFDGRAMKVEKSTVFPLDRSYERPHRGSLPAPHLDIALRMIANRDTPPSAGAPFIRRKYVYPRILAEQPFWGEIRVLHDLTERRRRKKKSTDSYETGVDGDSDDWRKYRDNLFWELIAAEVARTGSPWVEALPEARRMLTEAVQGNPIGFPTWRI